MRTRSQTACLPSDSPPPGSAPSCSCPPPPDLSVVKCSVCHEFLRLLNNQVPCCVNGHINCTSCALLLESPTCPFCKSPLEFTCPGLMISRLLEVESCDNTVLCHHGCGHQGSLVEVTRHEEDCTKGMQMCSNQGCEEVVLPRDMTRHQIICPYSPIQCFVCNFSFFTLAWSTDHPACFKTLEDIIRWGARLEDGQMLLENGRVTVFISNLSNFQCFLVFGMLKDGEEDRRVRVRIRMEEEHGELVVLLTINKWADWQKRVWTMLPFGIIMDIGLE